MTQCTDSDIGKLRTLYETGDLDTTKSQLFEEHLLTCDHCLREVESSVRGAEVLLRARPALRRHYALTNADFASEFRSYSGQARKPRHTTSIREGYATLRAWFRARPARTALLPSVAVALVALFVYLGDNRAPEEAEKLADGKAVDPTEEAQSGLVNAPDSTVVPKETRNTPRDSTAFPKRDEKSANQIVNSATLRLLPQTAIAFSGFATRGYSERGDQEAFLKCMEVYKAGEFKRAADLLRNYTMLHSKDGDAFMYWGSALYMTGSYEEAATALAQAERLTSTQPNPRVSLYRAAALLRTGRPQEAAPILERIATGTNRQVADQAREILATMKE